MGEQYTGPRGIKTAPSWRRRLAAAGPEPLGSVADHLAAFTQYLESRPAAVKTVERYTTDAAQFDAFVAGAEMTLLSRHDVEQWMVHQIKVNSPVTAATKFISLRQFFKFAAIVAAEAKVDFTPPTDGMTAPLYEAPLVAVIPDAILAALIRDAETLPHVYNYQDRTFEDARDAAILRVFIDTGIRLAELTALSLSDALDLPLLTVVGKGKGKGPVLRQVRVGARTVKALKKYLRLRQHHPAAAEAALWVGQRGPMTAHGIRQTVLRRSKRLGHRVRPHQFRHTFAHGWKRDPARHDGDLMELMG